MSIQSILDYSRGVLTNAQEFLLQPEVINSIIIFLFLFFLVFFFFLWLRRDYRNKIKILQQQKDFATSQQQAAEHAKILAEAKYQDVLHQQKQLLEKYKTTSTENERFTAEINTLRPYKVRYQTAALHLDQVRKQVSHLQEHNHRILAENNHLTTDSQVVKTIG